MDFPNYGNFDDEKERPTERKLVIKDQASYSPPKSKKKGR